MLSQVTMATMYNNNRRQSLSPCTSSDEDEDVNMLMPPPYPPASNESVLQHFKNGTTRLYSFATQTEVTAREVLANKMVLLYFSASWCGPCKRFTPHLLQLYQQLQQDEQWKDKVEVVFCSSDMILGPWQDYAATMPWWSLPLKETAICDCLSAFYQTAGIPHLVMLDTNGSVLHQDAVHLIASSPKADFPWRPKRFVDLLPRQYIDASQQPPQSSCHQQLQQQQQAWPRLPTSTGLDSKHYLLIYAGSHAYEPCQKLTPKIAQVYQQLKAQRDDFEFLYLSSDRNQSDYDACLEALGCCAIPYEERQAATDIAALYDIQCVPTLLLLGPVPDDETCDRPVLNRHVRDLFWQQDDPATLVADFPFCPLAYGDLNQVSDSINETKCLVLLCEACDDEEQEEMMQALQAASQIYKGCKPVRFYWAREPTALTKSLREALRLGPPRGGGPNMVLLDFPSDASYYVSWSQEITVDTVLAFAREPGRAYTLC